MTGVEPGVEVGRGMRSTVHAWGSDAVVKVPLADTPDEWTEYEFRYARAAVAAGVSAAEHREVVEVDGRLCSVATRIHGWSMIEALIAQPERAESLAVQLGELQCSVFLKVPSVRFPRQTDRLSCKLGRAAQQYHIDVGPLVAFVSEAAAQADGLVVCHGDLHPRNVLLTSDGLVLVDWFDACRGIPIVEVARTVVLLEQVGSVQITPDLAILDAGAYRRFGRAYLRYVSNALSLDPDELSRWVLVQRAARMAEGIGVDCVDELRAELASSF